MTAGEILDRVDALRPNSYSPEQKLRWLRRLDGQILLELLETHERAVPPTVACGDTVRFAPLLPAKPATGSFCRGKSPAGGGNGAESVGQLPPLGEVPPCLHGGDRELPSLPASYDQQTELLAPFPWGEGVYIAGLFCQIDLHNGEIQKYNQSLSLLAAAWRSLADWINRGAMPKGAGAWKM